MTTYDRLHTLRDRIQEIAARHGVVRIRVFGSVVRREDALSSDVDFLVATGPDVSPWFPAGLILDLEELLGKPVDVVTERGLDSRLRERVLQEALPL